MKFIFYVSSDHSTAWALKIVKVTHSITNSIFLVKLKLGIMNVQFFHLFNYFLTQTYTDQLPPLLGLPLLGDRIRGFYTCLIQHYYFKMLYKLQRHSMSIYGKRFKVCVFVPNTKLVDIISNKIMLQLVGLERINFT